MGESMPNPSNAAALNCRSDILSATRCHRSVRPPTRRVRIQTKGARGEVSYGLSKSLTNRWQAFELKAKQHDCRIAWRRHPAPHPPQRRLPPEATRQAAFGQKFAAQLPGAPDPTMIALKLTVHSCGDWVYS